MSGGVVELIVLTALYQQLAVKLFPLRFAVRCIFAECFSKLRIRLVFAREDKGLSFGFQALGGLLHFRGDG